MVIFSKFDEIIKKKYMYEQNLINSVLKFPKRVFYGIGESASYALNFLECINSWYI